MIDGLHPHTEMMSSGVEWLPALPAGWQIRRAKYSFQEADDRPLNIRTLLKEKVPVPPPSEQARLVELVTLEKQLAGSLTMFADRLREFRTRLIADVVTGKLDVRAAAASLPEVAEPEPIDDLAEGDDLDEAIDAPENEEVAA